MKGALYLILDNDTLQKQQVSPFDLCKLALDLGIYTFQWREKNSRPSIKTIETLKTLCDKNQALLIINDNAELAIQFHCGVHLGQQDLGWNKPWIAKLQEKNLPLGISTHSKEEIENAKMYHPDYLAFGSVFASPTKPHLKSNIHRLESILPLWQKDWVLIGGIQQKNIHKLPRGQHIHYAVISAPFAYGTSVSQMKKALKDLILNNSR